MHPAVRSQADMDQDEVSAASGLSCPAEEMMTSQVDAAEADINVLVRRAGAGQPMPFRQPVYGLEVDYDLDLLAVRQSADYAMAVYEKLSPEDRAKYASFQMFVSAVLSGEFKPTGGAEVASAPKEGSPPAGEPATPPAEG